MQMPNELYQPRTLFALGGASAAVVIATGAAAYVVDFHPRWLGLATAMLLAFTGLSLLPEIPLGKSRYSFPMLVIAFFNGLLIYTEAVGFNTLNHSIRNGVANQASILPIIDPVPWWVPTELGALRVVAGNTSRNLETIVAEHRDLFERVRDLRKPFNKRREMMKRRMVTLEEQRQTLLSNLTQIDPAEAGALRSRLNDLEREIQQKRIDLDNATAAAKLMSAAYVAYNGNDDPIFVALQKDIGRSTNRLKKISDRLNSAHVLASYGMISLTKNDIHSKQPKEFQDRESLPSRITRDQIR